MSSPQDQILGFQPESKVSIDARHWESLKRIVWRMKTSWGFVESECRDLIASCQHAEGCLGADDIREPCLSSCPDRQTRLSALVIYANAREFISVNAPKPTSIEGGGYIPPTREFFDLVLSELVVAHAELDDMKKLIQESGATLPPTVSPPVLPPKSEPQP